MKKMELASLLMQKYALLREEIIAQIQLVKSHVKHFQIVLSVIAALIPAYYYAYESNLLVRLPWGVWPSLMVFVITISNYLIFDIWEDYYAIFALSARLRSIEHGINFLANKRILLWETSGAEAVFEKNIPGIYKPGKGVMFFAGLLLIGSVVIFPNTVTVYLWTSSDELDSVQLGTLVGVSVYSLASAAWAFWVGFCTLTRARDSFYKVIRGLAETPWPEVTQSH